MSRAGLAPDQAVTRRPARAPATGVRGLDEVGQVGRVSRAARTARVALLTPVTLVLVVLVAVAGGCSVGEDLAQRQERAEEALASYDRTESTPVDTEPPILSRPSGPGPARGDVVAINRTPGQDYGRLVILRQGGERQVIEMSCRRVHVAADVGVCVHDDPAADPAGGDSAPSTAGGDPAPSTAGDDPAPSTAGGDSAPSTAGGDPAPSTASDEPASGEEVSGSYRTTVFDAADASFREIRSFPSPLPSRARVSADGSRMTTTGFVNGTHYEEIGETTTTETLALIYETDDSQPLVGLNQFAVDGDGERYHNDRRQFWGVSFAPDHSFWVTGFFADEAGPEILVGDPDSLTLEPTGLFGSCPSLAPDGATVVFKRSRPAGGFDLVALDVASGHEWELGETDSINDQVEWLDDDTILYAKHPPGSGDEDPQPVYDLWQLDIEPGSSPQLFAKHASSPAVIR